MDFDVSKVYTAIDADDLHVGDVVILADTMADLRMLVEEAEADSCKTRLTEIRDESHVYRFRTESDGYMLAYLIDSTPGLSWTELAIGDIIKTKYGFITRMVTGINTTNSKVRIEAGSVVISDEDLAENWVKCE
jgi:hypothetical protein